MTKFSNILKIALVVCMLCALCVVFAACGGKDGGGGEGQGTTAKPTTGATATFTVKVRSVTGTAMRNVSVYVYTDATKEELVTMQTTDNNGAIAFDAPLSTKYVAVLMGVPAGYQVEEYYPINSVLVDIELTPGVIAEEKPANKNYYLGDIVYDFTITDCNGVTYTLSELLEEKDAVVLNFWYLNCNPCKLEFPFLEQAYKEYGDRVEVLAINCEDGNDAQLQSFAKNFEEGELTFPMLIGDKNYWFNAAYTACPTTIAIDRYGTIVYMHTGYFDEVAPFNALFRILTAEDYQQVLIKDLDKEVTIDDYRPDGSKERPYELGGMTQIEIKAKANQEVYYNLYRLNNQTMRIENPNAYVIVDGETHYPDANGVIELVLTCPDTFSPVRIAFCNSSNSKNTILVKFIFDPGTVNNPMQLLHGDFNVTIKDVNGVGAYYYYDAPATGTLTLTVKKCTNGVTPDIHLYNENTTESVFLSDAGVTDPETGYITVSIQVNAGDHLQIIFSASAEFETTIYRATIQALASLVEDGGTGVIDGKQQYTVTVVDQNGNPVPGVVVKLNNGSENISLTTNASGKIIVRLIEGAYFLEMTAPNGYISEVNSYLWSPAVKDLSISLHTTSAYTVKLQTQYGLVLPNVLVRVYGDSACKDLRYAITTDSIGEITFYGKTGETFWVTLSNVTGSVQVQAKYTAQGELTILELNQTDVSANVSLGDVMPNFGATDVDGNYHTLQALLRENKMVIVTFWRTDCDASIRVLNSLQKLQELYGEEIAILALNPVDTLDMDLQMYQSLYDLTFPLAKCSASLTNALGVTEQPTTLVIDQEGKLCLHHVGELTEDDASAIVGFFTAEDYVHTTFAKLEDLLELTKQPENGEDPEGGELPEEEENPDHGEVPEEGEDPEAGIEPEV